MRPWLITRLCFGLGLLCFNVNFWTLDVDDNVAGPTESLDALVGDLRAGAGRDMQGLFPEGFVITHAIVGFAWVDVALGSAPGSEEHAHALSQARWLVAQIDSDEGRSIFPESLSPAYGAFYRGYLAWLRGGILLADPDDPADEVAAFLADCEDVAAALRAADTPYLESYEGLAWPGDSVFLAASLALHDAQFEPRYGEVLARWVQMARGRVDEERGMVPHWVVPGTGVPRSPSRGVSSVLMSRMLYEVDPEFARDQYARTREHFVDALFGVLPGVHEFADGRGTGDVDSGPLLFGFSGSASVVGITAARFHGDREYEQAALSSAHAVGLPLFGRYGFGLLPVGEAFFAWARTGRPWVGPPPTPTAWPPLMLPMWRFAWHSLSLLMLAALFFPEARGLVRGRRE